MTEHTIFIPTPRDRKGKPVWINANDRHHWAVKAAHTRAWRTSAWAQARRHKLPTGMQRVHITCTVHKTNNRSYDAGNLAPTAKAIVDGLVTDYGLLPDDSNEYLTGPDMRPGKKQDQPGITITIKETTQ